MNLPLLHPYRKDHGHMMMMLLGVGAVALVVGLVCAAFAVFSK